MSDALDPVERTTEVQDPVNIDGLDLEASVLLVSMSMVKRLEDKTRKELETLKERQQKVSFVHRVLRLINQVTKDKKDLDLSEHPDIKDLILEAADMGIELDTSKMQYTADERQRLTENLRMTCDDWNTINDMQLQTVTRFTNERYEAFQLARGIMKPLHDDKINKARSIGR